MIRSRTAVAVGLPALLAALLAGCGSSSATPVSLAAAPTTTRPAAATTTTTTTPPPTTTAVAVAAPATVPHTTRATTTRPAPRTTVVRAAAPTTRPPVRTTTPAARAASSCDPNYSGCVPVDSDVDCEGGSGNGPSYVRGPVRVTGSDVYGLDADKDGIGCE